MNSFLLDPSFETCARQLSSNHLNSQINESIVILRSLAGVYETNPRTNNCGFSHSPVGLFWYGYELQLGRYGLALATEYLQNRDLSKDAAASLLLRRARFKKWQGLVEQMEAYEMPDSKPVLIGDAEFHAGVRAWLLYKDLQAQTYVKWKHGGYPNHAVTRKLLPRKASWKRLDYEAIWEYFGKPDHGWYGQWGWTETPNDKLMFYQPKETVYDNRTMRREAKPYALFTVLQKRKGVLGDSTQHHEESERDGSL